MEPSGRLPARRGNGPGDAGARKVQEETGIEIDEPHFLEVIDAIIPDEAGAVRYHYTLIDFWAPWRAGEPVAADDAAAAEWIPLARLTEVELWETTRRVIADAVAARTREMEST
jgi:8-oxo-dGTP diphosphatase